MTDLESLAVRVANLEAAVARMQAGALTEPTPRPGWFQRAAGAFADDPVYDEIVRLGAEFRRNEVKI